MCKVKKKPVDPAGKRKRRERGFIPKAKSDQVKQMRSSSLRARTLERSYGCETTHFFTFQTLSVFRKKRKVFEMSKKWVVLQPQDRLSLRVKRAVQKVFVLPLTTYSVNRWFLGAWSGHSDQHDKWKVQLTVSVNQIQVQILLPFQSLLLIVC